MKKPYYLLIIVLGVALLIIGVFIYTATPSTSLTSSQSTQIIDRVHNSQGYVHATVEYPRQLLVDEEGLITLTLSPDSKVQKVLEKGLTVDSQLSTTKLQTSSDRRQVQTIDGKKTQLTWAITGSRLGTGAARLSIGLSDPRTDITLYPHNGQSAFDLMVSIVETKSKASFKEYLGPILMGLGALVLISGFVIASRDFDRAIKGNKRKKR